MGSVLHPHRPRRHHHSVEVDGPQVESGRTAARNLPLVENGLTSRQTSSQVL